MGTHPRPVHWHAEKATPTTSPVLHGRPTTPVAPTRPNTRHPTAAASILAAAPLIHPAAQSQSAAHYPSTKPASRIRGRAGEQTVRGAIGRTPTSPSTPRTPGVQVRWSGRHAGSARLIAHPFSAWLDCDPGYWSVGGHYKEARRPGSGVRRFGMPYSYLVDSRVRFASCSFRVTGPSHIAWGSPRRFGQGKCAACNPPRREKGPGGQLRYALLQGILQVWLLQVPGIRRIPSKVLQVLPPKPQVA